MDSLNRIIQSINEVKKTKNKKSMTGPTPLGKANRYDHDSFGMHVESSHMKKKKKLIGKQHRLDRNKNGKLDSQDFKMLRGESKEIIAILDLIKEAYQEELISEEAFLAIADPIIRSLIEGQKEYEESTNIHESPDEEDSDDDIVKQIKKERMKRRRRLERRR